MNTPGHDVYSCSGAAAGGAQIIAFTTGRGSPLGCALSPVVKITASFAASRRMAENMDVDISSILEGTMSLEEAGNIIFEKLLETASGQKTANEELYHYEFAIPRIGSTL
jgi:altronate dehydratase large subunit